MRIRMALAGAFGALALSAAGAPASGAVTREFFGVVPIVPMDQREFDDLGRGQIGTLRIVLAWPSVEPNPGQRSWGSYDSVFERAALQGIRVMPTLYGSPAFAATRTGRPPGRSNRLAWVRFVAETVARYGSGGVFWQQFATRHPGVAPLPPTDWQLWNEVNSPTFWLPRPKAAQYVRLLKPTASAIRDADPRARIVLAGLFNRKGQKRAVPVAEYIGQLYAIAKAKKLFDAVAIHPYAGKPGDVLKTVRRFRKLLRSNGDGKVPIWVTELGWATSGQPTQFTTTPEKQAGYLEKSIGALAADSDRLRVAGVIWYSLRDSVAGDEWPYRSGLFNADGTAKPSWHSYLRLTGGSYLPRGPGEPPPPGPGSPSCPLPPLIC